MNRLKSVTDWQYNRTTYNYDADGNLTSSVNPNGSSAVYQYDSANRLMSLTNTVNATVISGYQYTLDAVGNHRQVSQTEQLPTIPIVGQSTYAYDNDSRQITLDGQTQGFDANGNMTSVNPTNLLSYDYENRLVQTSFTDATNTFQYDGAGNRMSANRSGVVTRYLLNRNSPLTQVLAETDASSNVIYYYIYGVGLVSRIDAGGNAQYYHYDSRGSTIALTDASGKITEAYAYDPFGRPINGQLSDNHFRYLGRHGVMDEENGLLYIRARHYSTKRGRFITKDPTTGKDGDSQSLNRYIYALNNPVRLIDISGLSAQETSGQTLQLATSDSSLFHNILINPSNGGRASQPNQSTPLFVFPQQSIFSAPSINMTIAGSTPQTYSGPSGPGTSFYVGVRTPVPGVQGEVTVDRSGTITTSLGGGELLLSGSINVTSNHDFSVCWTPNLDVGVAEIAGSLCLGTDGLNVGGEASAGVGVVGFSTPIVP